MSDSLATPWTVAHQVPLSMGLSKQEHQSGLSFFSRGSSWPRDQTHVSCLADRFLYPWATWEAKVKPLRNLNIILCVLFRESSIKEINENWLFFTWLGMLEIFIRNDKTLVKIKKKKKTKRKQAMPCKHYSKWGALVGTRIEKRPVGIPFF